MKVTNVPIDIVGLGSMIQIPFPSAGHNLQVMYKKFDFSTQGYTIIFAHTTTLMSLDWALEFFEMSSIPSPFLLVATPLPFLTTSSSMTLNLFRNWPHSWKPF